MKNLTQKEIIEYLYQCYVKVDGLWFVKVEEQFGFDKALEIDTEVWKIVPKIQARFLKSKLSPGISGKKYNLTDKDTELKKDTEHIQTRLENRKSIIDIFIKALQIKLKLDGFKFSLSKNNASIAVKITECPWHNILIRSKRENLSSKIGSIICMTEYSVFASEFDPGIKLELGGQICRNDSYCIFNFKLLQRQP